MRIFLHPMNNLRNFLSSSLLFALFFGAKLANAQGYEESALELMSDTASWENFEDSHVGGAFDASTYDYNIFSEESFDMGIWTVSDSIARIPAYDMYCNWDTKNLFIVKTGKETLEEPLDLKLCHEVCDFVYPAAGAITSPFGPRWGRMHYGLDIDLETGDPVSAAFEGMVRISQYSPSYGNVVVIRHSNGLETLYAHLSERLVMPGAYIQAGDTIGLGGNTGRSYGSHLHFEVRFKGDAIDPNLLIDPNQKQLRDWEFTLHRAHFDYVSPAAKEYSEKVSRARSNKVHTVKRGETLSAIARKRGTTVQKLCKLNKIRETSVIREGQKLKY
ncbi:MAG: peptidoglycan DD-metalloendopeptidase family protein [Flavobacteriales bacterium]